MFSLMLFRYDGMGNYGAAALFRSRFLIARMADDGALDSGNATDDIFWPGSPL